MSSTRPNHLGNKHSMKRARRDERQGGSRNATVSNRRTRVRGCKDAKNKHARDVRGLFCETYELFECVRSKMPRQEHSEQNEIDFCTARRETFGTPKKRETKKTKNRIDRGHVRAR